MVLLQVILVQVDSLTLEVYINSNLYTFIIFMRYYFA
jgi:hypothetical protein